MASRIPVFQLSSLVNLRACENHKIISAQLWLVSALGDDSPIILGHGTSERLGITLVEGISDGVDKLGLARGGKRRVLLRIRLECSLRRDDILRAGVFESAMPSRFGNTNLKRTPVANQHMPALR